MKRISNISALIILVILVSQNAYCSLTPEKVRCDKTTASLMDTLAEKLIVIGQTNLKFPEKAPELRAYCNNLQNLFGSLLIYSRYCIPKFARDAMEKLQTSAKKEIDDICAPGKPSKKAEDLMRAAVCANSGLDDFQKCNQDLIHAYVSIMKADVEQRIPMACCHYLKFRECIKTEAIDEEECTKSQVDMIDGYFDKVLDNLHDFLCARYDTTQECEPLIKNTPKGKRHDVIPKSIITPYIDIISSIADEPI